LSGAPSDANHKWIGKLDALLAAGDDVANLAELRTNAIIIQAHTRMEASRAAQGITGVLYRALAAAELRAPVSAKGSFILAGNAFDAMAAIGKVLEAAKRDVLIVDPYMDEKAFDGFCASSGSRRRNPFARGRERSQADVAAGPTALAHAVRSKPTGRGALGRTPDPPRSPYHC